MPLRRYKGTNQMMPEFNFKSMIKHTAASQNLSCGLTITPHTYGLVLRNIPHLCMFRHFVVSE